MSETTRQRRQEALNGYLTPFKRSQGSSSFVTRSIGGSGLFGSGFSISPQLAGASEITKPYIESWVVYACVRAWVAAARGIPIQVYESPSDDAEPLPDGSSDPIAKLFSAPFPGKSWSDLIEAWIVNRLLHGEGFLFLFDQAGKPLVQPEPGKSNALAQEAEKLPTPRWMMPAPTASIEEGPRDQYGLITAWRYMTSGGSTLPWWAPSAVITQFDYNELDTQRGLGRSDVLRRQLSIAFQAERYQEANMQAGGVGGFLFNELDISAEELERQQIELDARSDDPRQTNKLKMLTGGKWSLFANPVKPSDMRGQESSRDSRDAVMSVFGVLPPVIGIFDDATYNNVATAWTQFYNTVAGELRSFEGVINRFLAKLQDGKLAQRRLRFDFSQVEALKKDISDRLVKAQQVAKDSGCSFDDACRRMGIDVDAPTTAPSNTPWMSPTTVSVQTLLAMEAGKVEAQAVALDASKRALTAPPEPAANEGNGGASLDRSVGERRGFALPVALRCKSWSDKPLSSPESRARLADTLYAETRVKYERALTIKVGSWMRAYQREVQAGLDTIAERVELALVDKIKERETLAQLLLRLEIEFRLQLAALSDLTLDNAFKGALEYVAQDFAGFALPMNDPMVVRLLAEQKVKLSEGVSSTIARRVGQKLTEILAEGATTIGESARQIAEMLPELKGGVAEAFGDKEARALAIARTEIGKATSNARILQLTAEGVEKIQWLSSHDAQVRETHQHYDGEVRTIGEEYAPNLRWPHDPNGPAEEVIACRCDVLGIVDVLADPDLPALPDGLLPTPELQAA